MTSGWGSERDYFLHALRITAGGDLLFQKTRRPEDQKGWKILKVYIWNEWVLGMMGKHRYRRVETSDS